MNVMPPVQPVGALPPTDLVSSLLAQSPAPQTQSSTSFSQLLTNGIDQVNTNLINADKTARAFALDDSIPVHQVTYALEQAQLSLQLMLQVRDRLIQGYQQLMNMQL